MTSLLLRPPLSQLVGEVRAVVQRNLPPQPTADKVASCMRTVLGDPHLLEADQRAGSSDGYCQHLLHVEPDGSFSVVALVWRPGQATPIHDHVCWCSVGVHQGEETEQRYRVENVGGERRLVPTKTMVNPLGTVCGIAPPGDIHQVSNTGLGTAISLHIYGADISRLGNSIRRTYD